MKNMIKKIKFVVTLLTFALALETTANAKQLAQLSIPELIRLSSRMIASGNVDKAKETLSEGFSRFSELEKSDGKSTQDINDIYQLFLLEGALELKSDNLDKAETVFSNAYRYSTKNSTKLSGNKVDAWSYLIKTLFKAKKYQKAVKTFEANEGYQVALNEDTGLFYAITNSYSESNDLDTAIEISLGSYGDKTPKHLLVSSNILFKSGLKKIALKRALKKLPSLEEDDILELAALINKEDSQEALIVYLEAVLLEKNLSNDIKYKLASLYIGNGNITAAEALIRSIPGAADQYAFELAELNMQLGNLVMAKYYNSLVNDPKKKLKQRLAIYLSQENFDLIASLDKEIYRYGLIKTDEFKYLLAYSKMKVGKLEDSDSLLNQIKAPSYLAKIIEIKKQISECKTNKASCIL